MFRIVCKSINSFGRTSSEAQKLFILGLQECSSSATRCVNQESFTVGYLINNLGFSREKAASASKTLHFQKRENLDAVLSFFRNQGFTHTQIRKLVSAASNILICSPQKTLLPKIQFFRSKGVSSTDLAKMAAFNYQLLTRSLKHCILPSYEFLRAFVGSDETLIRMLRINSRLLTQTENRVKPNIEILRGAGVPYSRILYIFKHQPSLFVHSPEKLKDSVEEVEKMGLDPQSCPHIVAVSILTVMRRPTWNENMEAYKSWGFSEDEVLACFKTLPWIMSLSQEKINGVMSFCVNEMGCQPSEVLRKHFVLLTFSLNKRIMPRWAVYKELVSKRLVKGNETKFKTMLKLKEDVFLEKHVNRYKNQAPVLLQLYLEKLEASN